MEADKLPWVPAFAFLFGKQFAHAIFAKYSLKPQQAYV